MTSPCGGIEELFEAGKHQGERGQRRREGALPTTMYPLLQDAMSARLKEGRSEENFLGKAGRLIRKGALASTRDTIQTSRITGTEEGGNHTTSATQGGKAGGIKSTEGGGQNHSLSETHNFRGGT